MALSFDAASRPAIVIPTPVMTPRGLDGDRAPWVMDTPSPTLLAVQKELSDPFQLRKAHMGKSKSLSTAGSPTMSRLGSSVSRFASQRSRAGSLGERTTRALAGHGAATRQLIRQVCAPFFERMVDAIEDALSREHRALGCSCGGASMEVRRVRSTPLFTSRSSEGDWTVDRQYSVPHRASSGLSAALGACDGDPTSGAAAPPHESGVSGGYPSCDVGGPAPAPPPAPAAAAAADGDADEYPFMSTNSCQDGREELRSRTTTADSRDLPEQLVSPMFSRRSQRVLSLQKILDDDENEASSPSPDAQGLSDLVCQPVPAHAPFETAAPAGAEATGSGDSSPALSLLRLQVGAFRRARGKRGGKASRGGADAAEVAAGGAKGGSICCHWRTKGWCRYEDACKFQHPPALRASVKSRDRDRRQSAAGQGRVEGVAPGIQQPHMAVIPAPSGLPMSYLTIMAPNVMAQSLWPFVAPGSATAGNLHRLA